MKLTQLPKKNFHPTDKSHMWPLYLFNLNNSPTNVKWSCAREQKKHTQIGKIKNYLCTHKIYLPKIKPSAWVRARSAEVELKNFLWRPLRKRNDLFFFLGGVVTYMEMYKIISKLKRGYLKILENPMTQCLNQWAILIFKACPFWFKSYRSYINFLGVFGGEGFINVLYWQLESKRV